MKISDEEFMEQLWKLQIKQACEQVLQRYVGGNYSVCKVDDFWQDASLSIHRAYRHKITEKIGKPQIMKRVRDLIGRDFIRWDTRDCTFILTDEKRNNDLFIAARNYWFALGVPTGTVNGCSQSIAIEDYEAKLSKAVDQLTAQHTPYWS